MRSSAKMLRPAPSLGKVHLGAARGPAGAAEIAVVSSEARGPLPMAHKPVTVLRPSAASKIRAPVSARVTALVGHELRTPLATALLYLGIAGRHLREAPDDDPMRAALALATGEVQKLEKLIARVIEIEREGRAIVRARPILLDRVVREALRRVLVGDSATRSEVEVAIPRDISGWWDDLAIEQIVCNLLTNALKFGQGRPIRVAVESMLDGVRLIVQDRGVGIRAADRAAVFQRSARAPVARAGGLGLGLWIVKKIVEGHAGQITVQSRPGQGTTFIVRLPQLRPPEASAPPPKVRRFGDRPKGSREARV